MIKVKNLNKYFNRGKKNELHVLNSVTVEFESCGLVCILGESGSGKTTLLNVIGGLDVFADGELDVEGEILKKYQQGAMEQLRNGKFGYIFQNYYLLQDYTVAYNVKLALNTFAISEEEKEERVDYVLEKLDMLKYKKKLVSQLSGGQQQRVSIARALVKSPKIILADEPTGNLDEENTLRTMSILKNISKECLVILVSHERRIADFFADRIIEIQDGKIIKDYQNQNESDYERMDDGNIYLQDMECSVLSERPDARIMLYQASEDMEKKLYLKLAWRGGRLYIQNLSNCDVVFAGPEIGCELVDAHKPNVEKSNIEEFEFALPQLKVQKKAKLEFREIWKMAMENIALMGRKQAFIVGILIITAVMLTITLANFTNGFYYDKKEVITSDSHYVTVSTTLQSAMNILKYDDSFEDFCEKYAFNGEYSNILQDANGSLDLQDDSFVQLSSTGVHFKDFSYVSIEHIEESMLIYGRMPEKSREIVIDRWLLDKFYDSDSPYKVLFQKMEDFLGAKLVSSVNGDVFEIVGICSQNEPSVYINQNRANGLAVNGYRIASIQELQTEYPGEFDELELKDNEVMTSELISKQLDLQGMKKFAMENERKYISVGTFPDEFGVDYVLNDTACKIIQKDFIVASKKYFVYTDDLQKTIKELNEYAKPYRAVFVLKAESDAQKQLDKYERLKKDNTMSRDLIAVAGCLISLFMIYFMIKSNVISRIEELTVYRLIGIAKGSIIQAYLLEMFMVTSYTVVPAVLLTSGVIKFIGSIPSLELNLIYPWWVAFALIAVIYLLNLCISIIPVWRILSKPPAVLAVKE